MRKQLTVTTDVGLMQSESISVDTGHSIGSFSLPLQSTSCMNIVPV